MGIEKIGMIDVADDLSLVYSRREDLLHSAATLEFQEDLRELVSSGRPGDYAVYDVVLKSADSDRTKTYSVDMTRNIVHISREGDNFLRHAVGLAEKCQMAGLGNFSVVKYPSERLCPES